MICHDEMLACVPVGLMQMLSFWQAGEFTADQIEGKCSVFCTSEFIVILKDSVYDGCNVLVDHINVFTTICSVSKINTHKKC